MKLPATIQLVIPMAGLGTRFAEVGYAVPKPLLPIHGEPMFKVVLANLLSSYVGSVTIIAQAEWDIGPYVSTLRKRLPQGISLLEIDYVTGGPADTVELAKPTLNPEWPVVTANSDQYVDADLTGFYRSLLDGSVDGNILTMEDDDPKWSYAALSDDGRVTQVREKQVISRWATVGVYGFASAALLFWSLERMRSFGDTVNGEYYVAPAYNQIVECGKVIMATNLGPISDIMHGLGIPRDYETFLESPVSLIAAEKARALTRV